MRFAGQTVVVTGAGVGGMGHATAELFARDGAHVVVADIDPGAAERAASSIRASGGSATGFVVDLRDRAGVFQMIDQTVAARGAIDVLANVAGIYPHASFADMSEEFWDDVVAVDLKGPLFTCQAALRYMGTRGGGSIVNVASGAAFYGIKGLAAYSAAKAGLVAMSRVIALEAAPAVRVNVVVPGSTAHPGRGDDDAAFERATSPRRALTERSLMPSEVAEVIAWCSSSEASAVNGAILRVGAKYML